VAVKFKPRHADGSLKPGERAKAANHVMFKAAFDAPFGSLLLRFPGCLKSLTICVELEILAPCKASQCSELQTYERNYRHLHIHDGHDRGVRNSMSAERSQSRSFLVNAE
jgi:hypothetical protein